MSRKNREEIKKYVTNMGILMAVLCIIKLIINLI